MNEMSMTLKQLSIGMSTAIQKVNYPIHKGKPNPMHGKFYFVGSIPYACTEESTHGTPQIPANRSSKFYDTKQDAINAAFNEGIDRLQDVDCKWIIK